MQDVSDEAVRLPFEGNLKGNWKRRKYFGILLQVQVWIIINVIHFAPSTAVVIGDSPPTLGLRSTQETNVFPWKQTCHATIGLSNKIHLYREETAGDPPNLASVRWCDFWKPCCGLTVWAPAVIVSHTHLTDLFCSLYFSHGLSSALFPSAPPPVDPLRTFTAVGRQLQYWCCREEILFPAKDSRTKNRSWMMSLLYGLFKLVRNCGKLGSSSYTTFGSKISWVKTFLLQ